jgi:hypothetical protein
MDKYVTSPYIIPMVNQLINKLKITNEQISNSTAKNFGLKLIENIEGRFKNVLTDQQLLICTYLNPIYKDLSFLNNEDKGKVLTLITDKNINILNFWNSKKDDYPLLCKLVKKYFCLQASSTTPERGFSDMGNIITKLRNSLSTETVSQLVVLKSYNDLW